MQPSAAMREYLAEIYRLEEETTTVSTTSLADRLNVSAPAVPRMLKRLRNAGYVKHVPYQGFELTELGRQEALKEIRRHRILEVFLVNVMGFSWDETHELADEMSKGLNDAITQRMAAMTNYPSRCPHGEPIPDDNGLLPPIVDSCIMNLAVGSKGYVSRVRTHEPERLQYFATLGLVPGAKYEILGRAPFNGPMRLRVEREDVVIGVELTKSLWVTNEEV
ncbi:MAG: metal-dependent transcriptional regulator [Chloroflexi bacterium]|nr:metal-dependent transcriptional regulator [Ardenticatenaceae bacterium]MBL1127972.1 metal-dependent transcriptional regulator [Chloroflexota bacterium]NOG34044.1 metal-dependent transcriptional regulator [Chloroflexota bacterium]GIK54462.1 MAG: transcriptional regulator [Chloroflexota bacterium]